MKYFLCILAICALLKDAECTFDTNCIEDALKSISFSSFFNDPIDLCKNIEIKFELARQSLKACSLHETNIDRYEYIVKLFCDVHSDFRKIFDTHKQCLIENFINGARCIKVVDETRRVLRDMDENIKATKIKETCDNSTEVLLKCVNEHIGRPCGDKALKVYQILTESVKSILISSCLDTAAAGKNLGYVPSTDKTYKKYVKEPAAEAEHSSSELINAPFSWYIFLGYVIAVKWCLQ